MTDDLQQARREAEHAREQLKEARMLLATATGYLEARVSMGQALPGEIEMHRAGCAFMAATTLYPKPDAGK